MNNFWTSTVHTLINATLVHLTLHVSNFREQWKSWLANVTFDWRHSLVMEMAVEHNNQTCRFVTFLHRIFYKIFSKTVCRHIMNKNDVNKRWISFFWHYGIWMHWVPCKVNVTPFDMTLKGHHLQCKWPIVFILWWKSEQWNLHTF